MSLRGCLRYGACIASCGALIWFGYRVVNFNATTAALAMLLLVLGVAAQWGLREATVTSLVCVLGFNYYFLPPIGAFTIADPQNWTALVAFLATAVTASQLSARAKRRAEEASARRAETERLYTLSRAMLMAEAGELVEASLRSAADAFGLSSIAFFDISTGNASGSKDSVNLGRERLQQVAVSGEAIHGEAFAVMPVMLGSRIIGSLGFEGRDVSAAERDAVANLIAINNARAQALDRAATAEAARRGERLKTALLDGIAHDLKTPLTAIKTCVTTLITIPPDTAEKREELLTIIDEETDRVQRTVTEAIQLARLESGNVALRRRTVRIRELLDDLVRDSTDEHEYVLDAAPTATVFADPARLAQALTQVLENARKYSPAGQTIQIEARERGANFEIRVLDRGPGIAPAELELIFEKFYRGSRGRAKVEGTGMGLSIARGIIEAHGGKIFAENRPEGGAVITFTVPAPKPE